MAGIHFHGRRGEGGADDRQADAGVTPEQLLHGQRDAEAGLVEPLGGEEVEGVEPIFAASCRTGHGKSLRSSYSAAAGRTTFALNSCTHFCSDSRPARSAVSVETGRRREISGRR
jgi:hypothetical protein